MALAQETLGDPDRDWRFIEKLREELRGLGHARTPDAAAVFFANLAGVEPSTPRSGFS